MNKPFVMLKQEMKDELTAVVNKHINLLPADDVADFLEKLTIDAKRIALLQLEEEKAKYEKAEETTTE